MQYHDGCVKKAWTCFKIELWPRKGWSSFHFLRKRIGSVTRLNMYTSGIHVGQHMYNHEQSKFSINIGSKLDYSFEQQPKKS